MADSARADDHFTRTQFPYIRIQYASAAITRTPWAAGFCSRFSSKRAVYGQGAEPWLGYPRRRRTGPVGGTRTARGYSPSRFRRDLYGRTELSQCAWISRIRNSAEQLTLRALSFFPGLGPFCLLRGVPFCIRPPCGSCHTARRGLGGAELCRSNAILVQPVLRQLRSWIGLALHRDSEPVVAVRCGPLRWYVFSVQGQRAFFHRRYFAVSSFLRRTCR